MSLAVVEGVIIFVASGKTFACKGERCGFLDEGIGI